MLPSLAYVKMRDRITYNFLLAGHTRFMSATYFGLIKQTYHRGFISLIFYAATAVKNSPGVNLYEMCGLPNDEVLVLLYLYMTGKTFLGNAFALSQKYCDTTTLNFP